MMELKIKKKKVNWMERNNVQKNKKIYMCKFITYEDNMIEFS